ncbi:hypothetical protein CBR_g34151 [Chara braunii]|uniref:CCHC-type domain-containing protein n=1 Tax=Chara braunii TaxID=69332 RepID=A0A388LI22_CHABU|nr:hypothetical protein CBR_g34151 [Chara braunii]|eukprot:GBG81970.1 hypothetical protein CBR_g34151 [Chara braunii]
MTEAGDLVARTDCNERGHYANQCPSRWRAPETKASTSYDVNRGRSAFPRKVAAATATVAPEDLRRQIEELNKSLASVSEFVLAETTKKAEDERLRIEAEEEPERLKAEQKAREKKEQKRIEKQTREAQRAAEIDKKVELQLAIKTGDFLNRMEASLGAVLEFAQKVKPVKQKVHIPSDSGDESYESGTEDIRAKTKKLTIHEKRKRGPEVVFEDSPPMVTSAKRTPRRSEQKKKDTNTPVRITRSIAKLKTKLSPLIDKFKKIPGQPSTVEKLRYRNQQMKDLRSLDALELQGICKDERVAYVGKIDAIFDIASHRTRLHFGEIEAIEPVLNLAESLNAKPAGGQQQLTCKTLGGNTWVGGWKKLRKSFGESTIREGKTEFLLKAGKKRFKNGGTFVFVHMRKWKPKARILKAILVGILRNPKKISEVYRWGLKSLMNLYNVIKDFSKKSTRKYLRRLISRVVHDSFGFSLSADLVIRVKFDDRIRLVELRKLMNDGIMACELHVCIRNRAMKKVRIVWVENPSIGHTLHNQRAFASRDTATCVCAGSPHPKEDGHVCFRLCDDDTRYERLSNTNDIPRLDIPNRISLLRQEVVFGFSNWYNLKGFVPDFSRFDFQVCFGEKDDSSDRISVEEVNTVKRECDGMVLTPLDRNAGETLVICPFVYYRAMIDSFVTNVGYRIVKDQEREVLAMVKMEVREEGLTKFARWDEWGAMEPPMYSRNIKTQVGFDPYAPPSRGLW